MNLTKAIEILSLYEHASSSIARDDFLEANKLGIEALKRHKTRASLTFADMMKPLPGESKD